MFDLSQTAYASTHTLRPSAWASQQSIAARRNLFQKNQSQRGAKRPQFTQLQGGELLKHFHKQDEFLLTELVVHKLQKSLRKGSHSRHGFAVRGANVR